MKKVVFILSMSGIIYSSCAQDKQESATIKSGKVGGPCEGCEAIYENTTTFDKLGNTLYLPGWNEPGGSNLEVTGIVYKADGKTPAPNVILYLYHTDQKGVYSTRGNVTGWGKRHGYIRGWLRTNNKGEYRFVTKKPMAYPNRTDPAHIHITLKEPGLNEYYIDEFLFDDDPRLTDSERKKLPDRGGSGILITKDSGKLLKAQRDIYLGQHIPGYPNR